MVPQFITNNPFIAGIYARIVSVLFLTASSVAGAARGLCRARIRSAFLNSEPAPESFPISFYGT